MVNDTYISERVKQHAMLAIERKLTVREIADITGVSKTTVHKDLTTRLEIYHPNLVDLVRAVLILNFKERSIRGGKATRKKYSH